jgi:hypothetical protein
MVFTGYLFNTIIITLIYILFLESMIEKMIDHTILLLLTYQANI